MKKLAVLFVAVLVVIGLSPVTFAPPNDNPGDKGPLTKIVFIHYKKGNAKPPWAGGGDKGATKCYTLLAKGAKWKTTEDAVVNPANNFGLSEEFLVTNTLASREVWDDQTNLELFGNNVVADPTADWDDDATDGRNEYSFGNYPQDGVIAVTVVWGYFFGPPQSRELVEYDVLFDTDFVWGDATVNSAVMDYLNIATHETGHGAGLGDVYETACTEVTMYGYSENGETKKRTLESQDINGLHELYPA